MCRRRWRFSGGWLDARGELQEQVFDVDLAPAANAASAGAAELSAQWTDPDFVADQQAFYYARAIYFF